jgi:hypothetical protein
VFTFGEAAYPTSSAGRYEQPEEPHRMMRGGSSWSRTFSSSVRPSVWSARRVSSGRRRGSLDQAVPLISITTCATCAPRVISQSQPCASTPARTCLPRFALISQLTTARLGERVRRVHLGPEDLAPPTSKSISCPGIVAAERVAGGAGVRMPIRWYEAFSRVRRHTAPYQPHHATAPRKHLVLRPAFPAIG